MIELSPKFEPFFGTEKRYSLITGGRGSSKSYSVNTFLIMLSYEEGHKILFTRYTLTSAHISIIPEFIDKIETLKLSDDFIVTRESIINKISRIRS